MLRIYPAFITDKTCECLSRTLRAAGLPVDESHKAGAAVIRAVKSGGGGLVLCGPRLSDMTAQQLSQKLGEEALVVVLTREPHLIPGDAELLRTLPLPVSMVLLAQRVSILLRQEEARQRARHRLRNPVEEEVIKQAKDILAERLAIGEQEAHRLLQHLSMRKGQRMSDIARTITSDKV